MLKTSEPAGSVGMGGISSPYTGLGGMGGGGTYSSGGLGSAPAGGFKRADKRATITILVLGDGTLRQI
jgi:hypothetical protein